MHVLESPSGLFLGLGIALGIALIFLAIYRLGRSFFGSSGIFWGLLIG
jgi:hypothetical protein